MKYIKNCPKCGKELEYGNKSSLTRSIRMNCICKDCMYKRGRNFSKDELEKLKDNQQLHLLKKLVKKPTQHKKNCPSCNKEITYSSKDVLRLSLRDNWKCRTCSQKGVRALAPKEKIKRRQESDKIYYKENKDRINKRCRGYNKKRRKDPNHIKKEKEYAKEYHKRPETIIKNRIRTNKYNRINRRDPLVRMSKNISGCIRSSLQSKNLSKNGRHWEDLVGYTAQQLKKHIEEHFKQGMNWSNQGKKGWVLDHIIPRKFFKYQSTDDVEFKYCWSLNNLQPLWETENREKGDKILLWGEEIRARDYTK